MGTEKKGKGRERAQEKEGGQDGHRDSKGEVEKEGDWSRP